MDDIPPNVIEYEVIIEEDGPEYVEEHVEEADEYQVEEVVEEEDPEYKFDDMQYIEEVEEDPLYDPQLQDTGEDQNANPKRRRKRNKVADPKSWVKNVRKSLRNAGKEYVSTKGKPVRGRGVQPKDCSTCKKNCNQKFPEDERQKIHESYWKLPSDLTKKWFISSLVEEVPKRQVRTKAEISRRQQTRQYFLRVNKKKVTVCKGFFLATLDISESVVSNILKNRDETSYFPRESMQGRHKSSKARPETAKEMIREHIQSFILSPESDEALAARRRNPHDKKAQYVAGGLNVKRMFNDYVKLCKGDYVVPEKEWIYRKIIKEEFNVVFLDHEGRVKTSAAVKKEEDDEKDVDIIHVGLEDEDQTEPVDVEGAGEEETHYEPEEYEPENEQ